MAKRATVNAIVIVAIAHAVVAVSIWWLTHAAPALLAERQVTAPVAIQRIAEMHAEVAAPSLVAGDSARLAEIVNQSSEWPEIVYLSIENAQGRILAHTDPAQTGRVWSNRVAAAIRATVRTDYEEVVAPVASPAVGDRSGARLGQVRLGYVVDAVTRSTGETRGRPVALWLVLAVAGLVAVPAGLLVARVIAVRPEETDWPTDEHDRADDPVPDRIRALHAETERLRRKLEERSRRLDERNRELDQQTLDLAEARSALEASTGERDELHRAIATHLDELETLRQENADWQAVVRRLRAELDGRAAELPARALRTPLETAELSRPGPALHEDGLSGPARHAVRQLLGGAIEHISHVLRGSLTNVLGFSKLLLRRSDGPLNEVQAASVTSIQDAGLRLLSFVNVLSEYARAEAGMAGCRPESVDVGPLLRDVVSELDRSGAALAVKLESVPEPAIVRADPTHLRRILSVLIHPAASSPGEGEVVLALRPEPGAVELAVAHPRWALSLSERSTLFEPFARDGGAASRLDDARIHLALARSLAALNRGELRLEDREDLGVLFTLTIPTDATP